VDRSAAVPAVAPFGGPGGPVRVVRAVRRAGGAVRWPCACCGVRCTVALWHQPRLLRGDRRADGPCMRSSASSASVRVRCGASDRGRSRRRSLSPAGVQERCPVRPTREVRRRAVRAGLLVAGHPGALGRWPAPRTLPCGHGRTDR